MAELVTIPIAFLEVTAEYERPRFWIDRTIIVEQLFIAFGPWEPRVDDMEIITAGKISEQGVTIKLPQRRASFFFGPTSCKFVQEGVNWQSAEETLSMLDAAISTLTKVGGVNIAKNSAAIAMHAQLKTTPFISVLKPLLTDKLASLDDQAVTTIAVVAKWPDRKVTIDGSGVLANAVFIRLDREFSGPVDYKLAAEQLRQDEIVVFRQLGLEEDLS